MACFRESSWARPTKKKLNLIFEQNANTHAKDDRPKPNNATIKTLVSGSIKTPSIRVINLDIIDKSVNSDDEDSADFQESVAGSRSNVSANGSTFYKTPPHSIQSDPGNGVLDLPKGSLAARLATWKFYSF